MKSGDIIRLSLPQDCRIICVSDIHGHCTKFKELLLKCRYNPASDYLFILGDFLEKGPENLDTLLYVKSLCDNDRIYCVCGNNDWNCVAMAFSDDKESFAERIRQNKRLFSEMGEAIGIYDFEQDFEKKRRSVFEKYKKELEFVRDLPLAVDTDDYIFVHAGIENRTDWENTDEDYVCCVPWFLRAGHSLSKTVVVGHFPSYNYGESNNTNLPIIDADKRIINIDGGAGVKGAGQLNAFIMNKTGKSYEYETVWLPLVPSRTVITDVVSDYKPIYCDYEKSDLDIIEQQGDFKAVYNKADGAKGLIPENWLGYWNDKFHGWINLSSFLSVKKGECFYAYNETENFYFGIAQNGQVGFVPKTAVD